MEDLLSKVKNNRTPLEKIMSFVPLYHGYKEKELRRESDRIIRTHIYQVLTSAKLDIKKTQTKMVNSNQISLAKNIDSLITKCDTISQKINRAESGYSGFWDATKVQENDLDRLYNIDVDLITIAEIVKQTVKTLMEKPEEFPVIYDEIIKNIESFDGKMIFRTEILRGFS